MARARRRAYGLARAKRRVEAGRFTPPPGWQRRCVRYLPRHDDDGHLLAGAAPRVEAMPDDLVAITDQALALERIADVVDAELWRTDKRTAWTAILVGLAHRMDWTTGLIGGVTRAHLAERAGVGLRTVTSALAWAQAVGLLVVVETGASAASLGTDRNRCPSYVLTMPRGWSPPPPIPAGHGSVELTCDPPLSEVRRTTPRRDRGLNLQERHDDHRSGRRPSPTWPVFEAPTTAAERGAAVDVLLDRAGCAGRVVRFRAVAMFREWFEAGWSVMGLLHAIDHHPDDPGRSRGDAIRSARDPLRVLGHRLAPWRGRLADLASELHAQPRRPRAVACERPRRFVPVSSPEVRAAAMAAARSARAST